MKKINRLVAAFALSILSAGISSALTLPDGYSMNPGTGYITKVTKLNGNSGSSSGSQSGNSSGNSSSGTSNSSGGNSGSSSGGSVNAGSSGNNAVAGSGSSTSYSTPGDVGVPSSSGSSGGNHTVDWERSRREHGHSSVNNKASGPYTQENFVKDIQTVWEPMNFFRESYRVQVINSNDIVRDSVRNSQAKLQPVNDKLEAPFTVGDPVSLSTGQFYFTERDTLARFGINTFGFERYFHSGNKPDGALGKQWFTSIDSKVGKGELNPYEVLGDDFFSRSESLIEDYRSHGFDVNISGTAVIYDTMNQYKQQFETFRDLSDANFDSNKYVYPGMENELAATLADRFIYRDDMGNMYFFYKESDKFIVLDNSKPGFEITENQEGGFDFTYTDGMKKVYGSDGLPLRYIDRYGVSIDFNYYTKEENKLLEKKLKNISCNGTILLTFTWNVMRRLASVYNNVTQENVRYGYDDEGNMVAMIDSCDDWHYFDYDEDGDIKKIINPDDSFTEITYSKNSGQKKYVSKIRDPNGSVETFIRSSDNQTFTHIDADGISSSYKIDYNGNVLEEQFYDWTIERTYAYKKMKTRKLFGKTIGTSDTNVAGFIENYEEIENSGNRESDLSTDNYCYGRPRDLKTSDGHNYEFIYDDKGSLTRISVDSKILNTISYTDWGAFKEQNGRGGRKTFAYDDKYNVIMNDKGSYEYDDHNNLDRFIDKEGNVWSFTYSADKKYRSIKSPSGLLTELFYDERKNLVQKGETDLRTGKIHLFLYEYDNCHNLLNVFSGYGNSNTEAAKNLKLVESYKYSPAGRLLESISWNKGNAVELDGAGLKTSLEYSSTGLLTKVTKTFVDSEEKAIGASYTQNYSYAFSNGVLTTTVEDSAKKVHSYAYNIAQRKQTNNVNLLYGSDSQYFDKNGRLFQVENVFGGQTRYVYNCFGDLERIREHSTVESTGAVRPPVVTPEMETSRYFTYDAEGRIQSVSDNAGTRVEYSYDKNADLDISTKKASNGSLTTLTSKNGEVKECYAFDKNGSRILSQKNTGDMESGTYTLETPAHSTVLRVDAWGNIIRNDLGYEFVYDEYNRLVKEIRPGLTITYSYNLFGKLSGKFTDSDRYDTWSSNIFGDVVEHRDAEGLVWKAAYSNDGLLLEEEGRGVPKYKYSYTDLGKLSSVKCGGTLIQKKDYEQRNVIKVTDGNNNTETIYLDGFGNFKYRKMGTSGDRNYQNEVCKDKYSIEGIGSFVDDVLNGEQRFAYEDGIVDKLEFDPLGAIVKMKNQNNEINFIYNESHQLVECSDGQVPVRSMYDKNNRRSRLTFAGHEVLYDYDGNGNCVAVNADTYKIRFEYNKFNQEVYAEDSNGLKTYREYDMAGRPASVVQKDSTGKIVFAQIVFYDENGRINYSVDKNGAISSYSYDKRGYLAESVMPFVPQLLESASDEMLHLGKAVSKDFSGEQYLLEPAVYQQLNDTVQKILGTSIPQSQSVWKEVFEYDRAGNRVSKTNALGKISYSYDTRNRLVKASADSSATFSYDNWGNVTGIEWADCRQSWTYTSRSQPATYLLEDYRKNRFVQVNYSYDSFGRLTEMRNASEGISHHYVYDCYGMDPLYEWCSLDSSTAYSSDGKQVRYAFFGEDAGRSGKWSDSSLSECNFNRSFIRLNGRLVCQLNEVQGTGLAKEVSDVYSLTTDLRGSVCEVFDNYSGKIASVSYDEFGTPLFDIDSGVKNAAEWAFEHGLDLGFTGKQYSLLTGAYNFGYRHYLPKTGRFTSVDPIEDGYNWYVYCSNDPVNFVDSLGLENKAPNILHHMQYYDPTKDTLLGNSKKDTVYYTGCYLNFFTGAVNTLKGTEYHLTKLNEEKEIFCSKTSKDPGSLDTVKASEKYGLKWDYWTTKKQGDLTEKINSYNDEEKTYVCAIKLHYDPKEEETEEAPKHWVGIEGGVVEIDNQNYVKIVATSEQDLAVNVKTHALRKDWWLEQNGDVYVPVSKIIELRVFETKEEKKTESLKNK